MHQPYLIELFPFKSKSGTLGFGQFSKADSFYLWIQFLIAPLNAQSDSRSDHLAHDLTFTRVKGLARDLVLIAVLLFSGLSLLEYDTH